MNAKSKHQPAEALYYECDEFWKQGMLLDEQNQQRIEETAALVPNSVRSLADIGCGNGIFLHYLQSKFNFSLLGVDRSQQALRHVQVNKIQADIINVPVGDHAFDCVTCLEVLEHIPYVNYQNALQELARISSQYILISVPYREKIERNSTRCPQCKSVFNTDLHFRSYDEETLKTLFKPYNYRCVLIKNTLPRKMLFGYFWYQKALQWIRQELETFHSPVCPVCSYENKSFTIPLKNSATNKVSGYKRPLLYTAKKFAHILKPVWPMLTIPGYWAIALYVKEK